MTQRFHQEPDHLPVAAAVGEHRREGKRGADGPDVGRIAHVLQESVENAEGVLRQAAKSEAGAKKDKPDVVAADEEEESDENEDDRGGHDHGEPP